MASLTETAIADREKRTRAANEKRRKAAGKPPKVEQVDTVEDEADEPAEKPKKS